MRWTIALLLLVNPQMAWSIPEWARTNTEYKTGTHYSAVCIGQAPSVELARQDAVNQCRIAASRQLEQTIEVTSISIHSMEQTTLHEEVRERGVYSGLICAVDKEEIEESEFTSKVYLKCSFDLAKAKLVKIHEESRPVILPTSINTRLFMVSMPRCDEIIIRGNQPRALQCATQPVSLKLYSDDKEIIIKANGYKPKTIRLNRERQTSEYLQVTLDSL